MDVMTGAPTSEQLEIIELDDDVQLLVTADPGTGKTYTLIRRAVSVAEHLEQPVLALSFTRAVVATLRWRAAEAGGIPLRAATIDAYAASLLRGAGAEPVGSFDAVVKQATELLLADPHLVARPDHVLVDEVQDLVGPRLTFVVAILRHAGSGFSLFGDPRQAIYEFEEGLTSDAFDDIRKAFPNLVARSLHTIHRGRVAQQLEGSRRGSDGISLMRDAPVMSSMRQAALALRHRGRDAVLLTRTNGEALASMEMLAQYGCVTTVRQGAVARMAPTWVARFAAGDPKTRWSRNQAIGAIERLERSPQPAAAWRVLRRIAGDGSDVSLARLRHAVANPWMHDDFQAASGRISTIHRAKGLEWDDVIVLDRPMADLDAEEQRVEFVAATRSRQTLWRLTRPDFGGRLVLSNADQRWELRSWQRRSALRLEARIGDVSAAEPYGADDAAEIQSLMAEYLPGDEVRLEPAADGYDVLAHGTVVGRTCDAFVQAATWRWRSKRPTLVGARLLCIRTAAGDPSASDRCGLGSSGLWLTPEIVGLLRPEDMEP